MDRTSPVIQWRLASSDRIIRPCPSPNCDLATTTMQARDTSRHPSNKGDLEVPPSSLVLGKLFQFKVVEPNRPVDHGCCCACGLIGFSISMPDITMKLRNYRFVTASFQISIWIEVGQNFAQLHNESSEDIIHTCSVITEILIWKFPSSQLPASYLLDLFTLLHEWSLLHLRIYISKGSWVERNE